MLLTATASQYSSAQINEWSSLASTAPVGAKIQFHGDWQEGRFFVASYCDLKYEVVLLPWGSPSKDQYGIVSPRGTIFCVKGDWEEVSAYFGEDETDTSWSWFDW